MPGPPTFPTSQIDFALSIMQAAKAYLEADPNLKVDGNLGVQSITLGSSLPDGTELILDWSAVSKCPGISVWCQPEGGGKVLTYTDGLKYELQIYVFVEHNRRRTGGHENNQKILESAVRFLRSNIERFSSTFVDGTFLMPTGDGEIGKFERAQRMRRRDIARGTIPLMALYSEMGD